MRGLTFLGLAGAAAAALALAVPEPAPVAASAVVAADTAGKRIFETKGNCFACHAANAKGTPLAPDLTDAEWLNGDGSLESITSIIKAGVPKPKKHPAPMPPMGGASLSEAELAAVARYVDSLTPSGG